MDLLPGQLNQSRQFCLFLLFLFLSFLFVFVYGCILSPPTPLSLPFLSLISKKKINAIILWIPQDSFGEKKNNKTLKKQINEQKYKLKLCVVFFFFAFLFVFQYSFIQSWLLLSSENCSIPWEQMILMVTKWVCLVFSCLESQINSTNTTNLTECPIRAEPMNGLGQR